MASQALTTARRRASVVSPVLALLCLALLAGCEGDAEREPAPDEGAAALREAPVFVACIDTVRRGDTFSALLLRNQIYLRDIERVIREVRRRHLFSLRRLNPGETVEIKQEPYGDLREIRYKKGPDEIYVIEVKSDSLQAYRTGLAYDIYLRKLAGTVKTTVDEALRAAGADPGIILELAGIFASDIDFLTESREGDRIVLLVAEKRYQGQRVGTGPIHYADYSGKKVRQTAVRFTDGGQSHDSESYYTPQGESLRRAFLRSPLNYRRISSRFSQRRFHPILRVWRPHFGVDYAAPWGTPVVALGDGVVSFAGWNGGFGRQVRIRHGSIYETSYGHLSRIARAVRKGARVKQGQVIGRVGSSGLSTGPHLDLRVKKHGNCINPLRMENPSTSPLSEASRDLFLLRVAVLEALVDSLAACETTLWRSAGEHQSFAKARPGVPLP